MSIDQGQVQGNLIIPDGQFVFQPAVSPTAIKQYKNIK